MLTRFTPALTLAVLALSAQVVLAQSAPSTASPSGMTEVRGFVRVVDGDTMEAWVNGQRLGMGLLGVSAPMGNTSCGRTAKDALRSLVMGGVNLEEDPGGTREERFRLLYNVFTLDGRLIAEELARAGVGQPTGEGAYAARIVSASADAQQAGRGCLWSDAGASAGGMLQALGLVTPLQGLVATTFPSGFTQDVVVSGLTLPTAFTFLPDGRILIAHQDGVVRMFKNGALLPTPFIDVSDRVNDYWDHGLLGIAADPSFATNGYVYLLYTYENNAAQYNSTKTGRLTRVTAVGDTASPATETVILGTQVGATCQSFPVGADCIPSDSPSHSVGNIKFAADGSMFVTLGDGASFAAVDDLALRAQSLDSLAGKVLRVTPTGQGMSSNPFWNGSASANRSKVWAYGLRNPYRFNLRPGTTVPYVGDVGWITWEEVNVGTPGANLGWPCYEGDWEQGGYSSKPTCQALYAQGDAGWRRPLVPWSHFNAQGQGVSSAATGGAFYTGAAYPSAYQGAYFYGDYGQGFIRYLKVDANNQLIPGSVTNFATAADGPVDIEMGPDQNLWYLAINTGQLRRIRYASAGNTPPTASASGSPSTGTAPLSVTFSSAGSIDPDGDTLAYSWNFGDGSAASTQANPTHVYSANGTYVATLTVSDGRGGTANATVMVTVGNRAPTATIQSPAGTLTYKVGDVVTFSGSGSDPEDGALSGARLSWQIVIHHCPSGSCHTHQLTTASGSSGSFTVPDHGDDSYFELVLTATDSGGLTDTDSVSIQPQLVTVTLASVPTGLQLTYDGTSGTTPMTRSSVVGSTHTLTALTPQGTATFASWSDGGAAQHNITVPASNVTYTATFNTPPSTAHSLSLNGTTAYADVAHAAELNVTGDWTVELWFKDENTSYNHPTSYLLMKGNTDTDPDAPFMLGIEWNSLFAGERTAWGNQLVRSSLANVSVGQWHHLAATMTAATRQVTIYLDGVQVAQGTLSAQSTSGNALPVQIGRNGSADHAFRGKLDDIRLWNVVRSAAEIQANRQAEISSPGASLVGYWKFNEGSGTSAADFGGVPQAATLRGPAAWSTDSPLAPPPPDTTAPTLSAITAGGITQTSATITWTTNESADSQIAFGTTVVYGQLTALDPALVTSHSQQLTGLTPGTTYNYQARSKDAAGNAGASSNFTFTTLAADTTPPTLTLQAVSGITTTSATVNWTTNEASDTQVEFGTTTAYGTSTTLNGTLLTTHVQQLTGLTPGTQYYYRARSRDTTGNLGTAEGSFTTLAPDTTPPTITMQPVSGVTSSAFTVAWTTNEPADTQVEYGTSAAFGTSTALAPAAVTSHSQTVSGLAPNAQYFYRARSRDAAGNLATGEVQTVTTLPAPDGGSVSLNGTTAFLQAPHASELNVTGDWTAELWFKDENTSYNHATTYLMIKGDTNFDAEAPFVIGIEWNGLFAGERTAWSNRTVRYALNSVSVNTWHHLAVTMRASTRQVTVYLNGVQVAQGIISAQSVSGNTSPVHIGRNGTQHYFRGKIDDVRLWNVLRTPTEIQASYSVEMTGSPTGLVGNWKLNDGAGPNAVDSTTTPQNATLGGSATWSTEVHP